MRGTVRDVMTREALAVQGSTPFKELVRLLNVLDHGGAPAGQFPLRGTALALEELTGAVDGAVAVETRVGWAADDTADQDPPSEPAPLA
jgi:hypothetical protein